MPTENPASSALLFRTLGITLMAATAALAVSVEDLPLIDPGVFAYQISSHNKQGRNGDGGWYLHDAEGGDAIPDQLGGWSAENEGAGAAFTREVVHAGRGALLHTIVLKGDPDGWRSIAKALSGGMNLDAFDTLSLYIWPTRAHAGVSYAIRINSGEGRTQLDIRDLKPGQWNHVVLDISKAPRQGVASVSLLYSVKWGAEEGTAFYVDDICFAQKDGATFVLDDFETGLRRKVLFDAVGPGAVRAIWGLGGSDIRIEADGRTILDGTQDDLFQGRVPGFPLPLVRVSPVASGPWLCVSHWSFVPIEFRERCRITTHHPAPFYHVIAERYRDASRLKPRTPGQDLSDLKAEWGGNGEDPKHWTGLREKRGAIDLAPGASMTLADLRGAGAVATLRVSLPESKELAESLWLRMEWDGRAADVEAPLGFFFGAGVRWQDIPSLVLGIRGSEGYSNFPMPFWKSARIRLENRGTKPVSRAAYVLSWRSKPYPKERAGYFHALYREGATERGKDWLFVETQGQGQFVGVVHRLIGGHYCEGDIRFYIDGSRSPAFYGTGTEDYYHQACWPNRDNHTPYHGCVGDVAEEAKRAGGGKTFYDFPASYYRMHLEAPVRFSKSIRCGIEHGGVNDTDSRYASLAFWYARDEAELVESAPADFSGTGVESLTGYFEGDDDETAVTCALLRTAEPVTRTLKIDPGNAGVRLRRVLDQGLGPQRAAVLVDGIAAGTWYDPDRNAWKRLAESEFELPVALVRGKRSIEVTFRPEGGAWTMGELRALSHVDR